MIKIIMSIMLCLVVSSLPANARSWKQGAMRYIHRTNKCGFGQKEVIASYYFEGQRTAMGKRFNPHSILVAHKTLPFHTKVHITNPKNGRSVTAEVLDRGPYVRGVEYDLSLGTARAIGMTGSQYVCVSR